MKDVSSITESGAVLYGADGFVYIHNNRNNYAQYMGEASQLLINKKNQVISAWRRQTKVLKQECDRNESNFFGKMSEAFKPEKITRQTFLEKYNEVAKVPTVRLQELINELNKFPSGKKTVGELRQIEALVAEIEQFMSELNLSSTVGHDLTAELAKIKPGIKKFESALNTMQKKGQLDENSTTLSKTAAKHSGALSISHIANKILPNVIEAIVHSSFTNMMMDKVGDKRKEIVQHTGKKTHTGTSADELLFNAGFSVKLDRSKNSHTLQQQKSRQLETFFNLNEELKTNTSLAGANATIFQDPAIVHSLQYVLANSKLLGIEPSSLPEIWGLLIISNLNEKIFGFNKDRQTDLGQLIPQLPIAVISSKGVAWTKDLINKLLTDIDLNFNSLASAYMSFKGDSKTLLDKLYQEKDTAKATLTSLHMEITYENIKQYATSNLKNLMQQALRDLSVVIQYYIPVKDVMNEYGF